MKLNKKGKNSTGCKVITKTYNQIKRKRTCLIVPLIAIFMLICVIGMIIIGINQNNRNGQMIADMEEKSDDILAIERATAGQSWTYNGTGSVQTFTVPTTGRYTFVVKGAGGADGNYNGSVVGAGYGSTMTGKIKLTQGTVLYLYVGMKGSGATGGWNGGGNGAGTKINESCFWIDTTHIIQDSDKITGFSGGGGGATDIRLGGTGLENRILVAPGGAGSGFSSYVSYTPSSGHMGSGGHPVAFKNIQNSNGQISGRGSDYNYWDGHYWENGGQMHRIVYSGGGGRRLLWRRNSFES